MNIVVRPFDPAIDTGLVYSTWAKGFYYSGLFINPGPKKQWFAHYHAYVQRMLKDASVSVAALADDPSTIIGYSVINGTTLEWIYVKELFRKQGIAKLLVKNKVIGEVNNLTKIGKALAEKYNLKEKQNGPRNSQDRQEKPRIQNNDSESIPIN